jgi:hypothetical protein
LFETFPSYYHFLMPFYRLIGDKETNDQVLKNIIWKKFMDYLNSEQCYADPVGYVLWVDFFEDSDIVRETWQGLMNYSTNKKALLRLIEYAGPVPFDLKEPVYLKLLEDENDHIHIFNSLFYSAFDIYGNIDNKKAGMLLSKLKVKTDSENYKQLKEKIETTASNTRHSK